MVVVLRCFVGLRLPDFGCYGSAAGASAGAGAVAVDDGCYDSGMIWFMVAPIALFLLMMG